MVREPVRQRAEELSQFLLGRSRRTVGLVPKKRNGLFFRSKLTLVTYQSFLVDVAQAKIQIRKTALLSALNPFPDQEIIRPVRNHRPQSYPREWPKAEIHDAHPRIVARYSGRNCRVVREDRTYTSLLSSASQKRIVVPARTRRPER